MLIFTTFNNAMDDSKPCDEVVILIDHELGPVPVIDSYDFPGGLTDLGKFCQAVCQILLEDHDLDIDPAELGQELAEILKREEGTYELAFQIEEEC